MFPDLRCDTAIIDENDDVATEELHCFLDYFANLSHVSQIALRIAEIRGVSLEVECRCVFALFFLNIENEDSAPGPEKVPSEVSTNAFSCTVYENGLRLLIYHDRGRGLGRARLGMVQSV